MSFQTVNPRNGEALKTYEHFSFEKVEKIIEQAQATFEVWRKVPIPERAVALKKLASNFKQQREAMAELMHLEMGKLKTEALAEIDKSISACDYYAENAAVFLKPQIVKTAYAESFVSFQPLGQVLSIMPWNFPLWQAIRFTAPALMAGNVVLLKHADLTAGTAELISACFEKLHPALEAVASLNPPQSLLFNIQADHETCARVIAHSLVRGVTFTGSTRGGKEIASNAAKVVKKTVLELGGSDAYVVLADADLAKAAKICATARLVNCGQSCVAAKRFVVDRSIAAPFLELFIAEMKKAELAPLAATKFQEQVNGQVEMLKKAGGKILLGGELPKSPGAFYPATVILFDKNPEVLMTEEIFGPVASVIIADNEKQAIDIANSSVYGLGGALFTENISLGMRLIETEMQAGFVVLNDQVKSDPHLPFGGVKESGYGRELGPFGIHEFVNTKTLARGN